MNTRSVAQIISHLGFIKASDPFNTKGWYLDTRNKTALVLHFSSYDATPEKYDYFFKTVSTALHGRGYIVVRNGMTRATITTK